MGLSKEEHYRHLEKLMQQAWGGSVSGSFKEH